MRRGINNKKYRVMNDKRFLKIKKVNEERYFENDYQFIRFIEKMTGVSWCSMLDIYSNLRQRNETLGVNYWETHMNLDRDFLKIGGFIMHIFRGHFVRSSGSYQINILSVQKTNNLTGNDLKQLFGLS